MSVTSGQIRDAVQDSMREAGCHEEEVNENGESDRIYCACIGDRQTASLALRRRLQELGLNKIDDVQVKDRVVFVNFTQQLDKQPEQPHTLLKKPKPPPGGHKYMPWSHVSLERTVDDILEKLQQVVV